MKNMGSLSEFLELKTIQKDTNHQATINQQKQPKTDAKEMQTHKYKRWKTVLDEYTPSKKLQQFKSQPPSKDTDNLMWKADYEKYYPGNKNISKNFQCNINLFPKMIKQPKAQKQKTLIKDTLLTQLIVNSGPENKKSTFKKYLQGRKTENHKVESMRAKNFKTLQTIEKIKDKNSQFQIFKLRNGKDDEKKGRLKKISPQRRIQLERSLSWARSHHKDPSHYQTSLNKSPNKRKSRIILQQNRKKLLKAIRKSAFKNAK